MTARTGGRVWLCAVLLLGSLGAQAPAAAAAFAADPAGTGPPALVWLRQQVLAGRREWPAGLHPDAAFTVHCGAAGLRIGAPLPLPAGLIAAGECRLDGPLDSGGTILFACAPDGSEDWDVDAGSLPPGLDDLVAALHVSIDGPPRIVDLPALLGNLAGPMVDGDARRELLELGSAHCGEVTFAVARHGGRLAVRGRSDGGLLLPALLLWLARADAATSLSASDAAWRLRAFGGRDGDRAEATRQLQRAGRDGLPALRALLHADEPSRLAAIDGLVRIGAAAELPHIVAAAAPDLPLATAMAATAVRELWPSASTSTRALVREALQRNTALDGLLLPVSDAPAIDARWRWTLALTVLAAGLAGLLLRERSRCG